MYLQYTAPAGAHGRLPGDKTEVRQLLSQAFLDELASYVAQRIERTEAVFEVKALKLMRSMSEVDSAAHVCEEDIPSELPDYIRVHRRKPFCELLLGLIDEKGLSDTEVYRRAGLDRRHFSKLRSPDYHPGKRTAVALALSLGLGRQEAGAFLQAAGWALSESDTFDLIILFCLDKGIFALDDVDAALHYFSLPPLGSLE